MYWLAQNKIKLIFMQRMRLLLTWELVLIHYNFDHLTNVVDYGYYFNKLKYLLT